MNFEELAKEFSKVKDDTLAFIRYFECNSEAINKLDDSDEEQKGFRLKMNGDYGLCLSHSGSTEKAVKVLSTFIPKFEKESGLSETQLLKATYYEHLLWAYGSSLFYAGKVDDTEKIFERLVEMQPDNQKYKNWLRATKEKRYAKIRTGLYTSVFAWLFLNILFGRSMGSGLKVIFVMTGMGVVCGTIILEGYLFILRRKLR